MGQNSLLDHPGGTPTRPGGKGQRCWRVLKKCLLIFLCWGILFGSQPIRSEAKSLSQSSIDDGIPEDIKEDCEIVGKQFNICPELLESMAYTESRFIPTVKNHNCHGLMQVNIKVHKDRIEKYDYTSKDMMDPYKNLVVAADYLTELYETYGDDNPVILSIYSGNWKAVEKYKEYGFLTPYVDEVLTRSAEYERIHGK